MLPEGHGDVQVLNLGVILDSRLVPIIHSNHRKHIISVDLLKERHIKSSCIWQFLLKLTSKQTLSVVEVHLQ